MKTMYRQCKHCKLGDIHKPYVYCSHASTGGVFLIDQLKVNGSHCANQWLQLSRSMAWIKKVLGVPYSTHILTHFRYQVRARFSMLKSKMKEIYEDQVS